jgi:hypothetical protein
MEFKIVSRRTEIAYKAEEADECAQHHEVQGSASTVNAAVVQFGVCVLIRGDLSDRAPRSRGERRDWQQSV